MSQNNNYPGPYLTRISHKSPDALIQESVSRTIQAAMQKFDEKLFEGPWTTGGLGIVSINPRNIAATNQATGLQGGVAGSGAWGVTAVTASTWTQWINLSIDDRIFLVVTGIMTRSPAPNITAIKPYANGQDLPQVSIEEMYTFEESKAYFTEPIIISPGNIFRIDVLSPVTLAGIPSEQIGLMGYTIGKRAYLINTA